MPRRRSPSRSVYAQLGLPRIPRRRRKRRALLALLLLPLCLLLSAWLYLRRLSCSLAMSDARDAVITAINDTVRTILAEHDYGIDDFVTLEMAADGSVAAIKTNTARVNAVSTEVLRGIIENADNATLELRIPLGNLLGSNLLLGRGPKVPVEILMLTSSNVRFDNQLMSTGINQTRHSILLRADVDIDILLPWATASDTIEAEMILAETVVVGRVPESYLYMEDAHGSS